MDLGQSISLLIEDSLIHSHLFEGTFNLHPLCPGNRWIGQTVPTVAATTHVYSLLVKKAERLRHHVHSIIGEGRGILKVTEILTKNINTSITGYLLRGSMRTCDSILKATIHCGYHDLLNCIFLSGSSLLQLELLLCGCMPLHNSHVCPD